MLGLENQAEFGSNKRVKDKASACFVLWVDEQKGTARRKDKGEEEEEERGPREFNSGLLLLPSPLSASWFSQRNPRYQCPLPTFFTPHVLVFVSC